MSYLKTTAYQKIKETRKRIRIIQGGTAAGKTVAILMYLITKALTDKEPSLTSVVSESFPHLKRGVIRDFLNIMQAQDGYEDSRWNKTDYIYELPSGSKIEFFSADQPGKVRGPRRDRLFINEANNVPFETYEQLEIRTKDIIFLDYNPISEFWVHTELINKRDDIEFMVLTYRDNEALDENIIRTIETRKGRAGWWKVFGEGLVGEAENKIYTGWQIIDEIPFGARLERYGLDFGYSNDPTAIVAVYYFNGGYILDERLYRLGMSNREIAETIRVYPSALTIADSAEPKSIDEIRGFGINITGAEKGKDSVRNGIARIQDQIISVTKQSVNLIKEYRNYLWMTDKNGKILNEPEKGNDDCLDAARYALSTLAKSEQYKSHWDRYFFDEYGEPKVGKLKEANNPAR